MTNIDPQTPSIGTVNGDPTKDQIEAALRQLVIALGPVVALFGVKNPNVFVADGLAISGLAASVIAIIYGQIKTRSLASKAAQMARMLPDHVAQTK